MTAIFFCNLKHTIRKRKKFSVFLSFSFFLHDTCNPRSNLNEKNSKKNCKKRKTLTFYYRRPVQHKKKSFGGLILHHMKNTR